MSRAGADAADEAPVELDADERELLTGELDALLPSLDGARRQHYARLRTAVANGHVPVDLTGPLESLLELVLQTARARTRHSAEGERILTGVYRRTPAGRRLSAHLQQVNDALRSLHGHTIESLSARMRTVGHFTLTVQTDGASVTLATRPDSLDVESISVGG